jgi:hypothetical protein
VSDKLERRLQGGGPDENGGQRWEREMLDDIAGSHVNFTQRKGRCIKGWEVNDRAGDIKLICGR